MGLFMVSYVTGALQEFMLEQTIILLNSYPLLLQLSIYLGR